VKKLRRNLVFQDSFSQFIGRERNRIQQLFPVAIGLFTQFGRNFFSSDILAALAVKINGLQADQVNHPSEIIFEPDGNLQQGRSPAEFVDDLILHFKGIGSNPVELIYKGQNRHLISFELFINGQGL